jgi:hypothetical protein
MTGHSDPAAAAFERALQLHAHNAPAADALLERVRVRIGRRRRNRRIGAGLLAATAVAAIVVVAAWMAGGSPLKRSEPAQPPTPDGWRWESSRGVEALVPDTWRDSWTYGFDRRCYPADSEQSPAPEAPYVGRSAGLSMENLREFCPRIEDRTPFVWLDDLQAVEPGIREHGHGWVEETRLVAGVKVTVFTDDDGQRHTVMDSLRPVRDTDVYGCPVHHPIGEHPETRPSGGGLATVGDVDAISVCSYTSELSGEDLPPLLASARLTGTDAQKVVDAILAAPEGSGPNGRSVGQLKSEGCRTFPGGTYGYQKMLLIVHGSQRDQEVVLRFGGCDHNGTDDGQLERRLTGDVLRPLLAFGIPNQPYYGLPAPLVPLIDPQ